MAGLWNFLRGTTSNILGIGDGVDGTKAIEANVPGANKPAIRFNHTTDLWEYSHNGTNFYAFVDPSTMFDVALVDGTYVGNTTAGTAGEALVFGNLCRFDTATSRWKRNDADVNTSFPRLGMCVIAAAGDGSATRMLTLGYIRADSFFPTLTIGPVHSGAGAYGNAGNIQVAMPAAGRSCRVVGYGVEAKVLYFNPAPEPNRFDTIHGPLLIYPVTDAANAIRFTDASASPVMTLDTTNKKVIMETVTASLPLFSDADKGVVSKSVADARTALGVGVGFVDRGDPATHDFSLANFTTDGTWRDLDLSSIVPAGAKVVLVKVIIADGVANSQFALKKNGNTNQVVSSNLRTQVAGVYHDGDMLVALDVNRVIEYYGDNLTFDAIYLSVKGWFI